MKAFQLSLITVIACSIVVAEEASGPLSPAESLRRLEPAGGLEISLFAHEPMVVNPTNIDIDERGRVWVAEGVDYRRHADLRPEGDRIVILEDTNGDGTADRSKTYYQDPSIKSPLGIGVFGRRVVVSCSPHVFLFIDEDGDDIPDEKRVLFSGIEGVQHDHGVHAFVFQPDGKLYFNFGNNGNRLLDGSGSPVVDAAGNVVSGGGTPYRQGMIFRCDLDGGNVETLGHNFRNNYEVTVDSFGTLWQSDNDDDGNRSTRINFVMEFGNYGYRDELTGASWKAHRTGAATDVPLRHFHQNDPGVVPNLLQTGAGSPTGICVYEGELLPKRFRGQLIHCDAGPNVVRSYPVKKTGAGYTAQNLQFVKGYDRWFRPSDVCVAADGSVFIADWYDAGVGGHQMADNVPGQIRGRIYRVAPSGHRRVIPPFSVETADGATDALKSPNRARWFRAWQTLSVLEEAAEEQLLELWKGDNPRWRARALQFLARMPRLGTRYLTKGLSDPNEDIRVTSLRIVRSLGKDVVEVVRQLVRDPSAAVRRECAIALRGQRSPDAASLWAELAVQHDGQDRWYVEALGIGAAGQDDRFFAAWLQKVGDGWDTPAGRDVVWRVRAVAAASLLGRILRNPSTPEERRPRYLRAFDFLSGPAKEAALETLLESEDEFVAAQALLRMTNLDPARNAEHKAIVDRLLERSRGTGQFVDLLRRFKIDGRVDDVFDVVLQHSSDSAGAAAVRWLLDHGGESLIERATEGEDDEKAFKVIQALGNANDQRGVRFLALVVTNEERDVTLLAHSARQIVTTKAGAAALVHHARADRIPPEVRPLAGWLLSNVRWGDVRKSATTLLPSPALKDSESLPNNRQLVAMKGEASRGVEIYTKLCSNCHQVGRQGKAFGPNLTEIGDKLGKDALYSSILDPNAGVSFDYEGVGLLLKTGDDVVGIIESETADEITLKTPGAILVSYQKSDIVRRRKLKTSIMPSGLQATLSTQELVDLVEYLSTLRKAGVQ